MPTPIDVAQGVVVDIRIPVPRPHIPQLWNQRVGLEEATQGGVVEAGVVIIQAQRPLPPLAMESAALKFNSILAKGLTKGLLSPIQFP
jgi:hypothetical protein